MKYGSIHITATEIKADGNVMVEIDIKGNTNQLADLLAGAMSGTPVLIEAALMALGRIARRGPTPIKGVVDLSKQKPPSN